MKTAVIGYNRNRDAMLDGYRASDPVDMVAVIDIPDDAGPEYVWRAMNRVDGSDIEQVPEGERSMCVGDVVRMDGATYAAASVGFERVDRARTTTRREWVPGVYVNLDLSEFEEVRD